MLNSMFDFKIKPKVEKIDFGEEQLEAISKLEDFIRGDEQCITLCGAAGTGKSSICREIIDFLEDEQIEYVVAAPTHRAKLVLEALTGCTDTYTVHQLLALSPNIEIFELDYRELEFQIKQSGADFKMAIPYNGVVIIDEASMINDDLFDLLIKKCKNFKSKIVFIGDPAQLRPVKSDHLSKAFSLPNIIRLTKVYRQKNDSPVLDVLTELREHSISEFKTIKGIEDSLLVYHKGRQFMEAALPYLKELVDTGNVLTCKILAYTNARVNGINKVVRYLVFGEKGCKNEFNKNEILVGTENFSYDDFQFYNSLDYVVKSEPVEVSIRIPHFGQYLHGYNLSLYDSVYKRSGNVFIISYYNDLELLSDLARFIEETRIKAIQLKQQRRRSSDLWKVYYETMGSFATTFDLYYDNRVIKKKTFDYGYATTVHKAQGISLGTVFVDIANINTVWNKEELQQLQYVAISRTRGDAHLLV